MARGADVCFYAYMEFMGFGVVQ